MQKSIFLISMYLVLSSMSLQAAHIIGGDVIYRCVSVNEIEKTTTFAVSFTMYRDVLGGGANYDLNAQFGVYRKSPGSPNWFFVQAIPSNPTNISNVPLNDPCVSVPPNIRVEKGVYHFNVTLPWDGNTYQIAYQRCCRNNTINNIINPQGTGAVFFIELQSAAIENCNNSAVFKQFPPIIVCNNRPIQFDHGTTDMEGDSIVYEFCAPLTSGGMLPGNDCGSIVPAPFNCPPPYNTVTYTPAYTSSNPMQGNPIVSINPSTGLITGTPNLKGQYVVGICTREYRSGVLLSSTRRDFQFNVLDCDGITFHQNYSFCENDSLEVNGTVYNEPGTFTQNFITETGCDSIVVLTIKELPVSEKVLTARICFPETYHFFEEVVTETGTYTQILENSQGCDSTIILHLTVNVPSESSLDFLICDDETVEINGETYDSEGTYTQKFTNAAGCDSTLTIRVKKGISYSETRILPLCLSPSYQVNGIIYDTPGEYIQDLQSQSGCDSILTLKVLPCDQNIFYDFELCDALTPEQSMNYTEFTPAYLEVLSCGNVEASNIYRDIPQENKHSCSLGHESSLAMCVPASTSCEIELATQKPVVLYFVANPDEGSFIKLNHIIFNQYAPVQYSWINGATGPNNYPTKFKFTVYKNGQSILVSPNMPVGNSWGKSEIHFHFWDETVLKKGDTIRLEWLPYCAVGINSPVSVWDLDDISLYFSCESQENRIVGGKILRGEASTMETQIKRYYGNIVSNVDTKEGVFNFPKNDPVSMYGFKGYKNDQITLGISTFDLVLIQRHILGIQTFSNPFQYVAADINRDGKINSIDLVELRKVILGMKEFFPNNTSWRFIPVQNTLNNYSPLSWEDDVSIQPGYGDIMDLDFIPVKIGDIDGTKIDSGFKQD